ncbi:4-hydroxy-tetrahydrodipicolinate reductase [Aquimonas sp.]|uniref:4-hydroxy-tetrahydrodipicolinate reductase n=1 Tax=Aquimonas sp. TaxID=1872588 RepID=UPI0037BED487
MSTPRPRLLIHGASGRMGRSLLSLLAESTQLQLVAAVANAPRADLGALAVLRPAQIGQAPAFDVAIDFSAPQALPGLAEACVARGAALVSGTTGLDADALAALSTAALKVPVLWAANFSLGVALLAALSRMAASAVPDWDCEIIETHHRRKQDAPSGTALRLGEAVAAGRGQVLADVARHGRAGSEAPRIEGEIGFHAMRGGDVVGDHSLLFAGEAECIELSHRALSREVFARGALRAAVWLSGRTPGRYHIEDVLGLPHS